MPALAKKRPCAISCFAGASLGAVSFWTSSFLVDRGSRTFSLWRSSDQNKTTWPNPADQGRKTKPMSSQARASTAPAVASRMKCASSSALQLQALGLSNTEHHGPQP
ncbi:hypothetical protein PsYK624_015640 [Phanerochaete sordida]|uniref:Uncharacterized protein n=1 Tax=Phanerochaete sordida TaxID=48140 RepID=A0A9P3G0I1_9APHY|nr:hypothetical protein PsYK624_015640 [Phanerochaete sordida]